MTGNHSISHEVGSGTDLFPAMKILAVEKLGPGIISRCSLVALSAGIEDVQKKQNEYAKTISKCFLDHTIYIVHKTTNKGIIKN